MSSPGPSVPPPSYRVRDAAALLAVSDDSVRRRVEHGELTASRDSAGRLVIDGAELARFARSQAHPQPDVLRSTSSARNRLVGLVTAITSDTVMSEVELQCGPFTITSLMSTASVRHLQLRPGSLAVAVVKATTVIIDTPQSGAE